MATTTRRVTFRNGALDIAGELHLPHGFSEQGAYAAIVIAIPGSSVKEQIGAVYGRRLAQEGFVALAFDPTFQGQSGGHPRDLESPAARVEDIRCAIDHLMTLPFIDEHRVGALGICAGGGYATSAAMIDHRIRALGAVVPVNTGRAFRQSQPGARAVSARPESTRDSHGRADLIHGAGWMEAGMDGQAVIDGSAVAGAGRG